MRKTYVYVGNWSFEAHPLKGKGISIYEFDEQKGSLKLLKTFFPEVAAGQLALDAEKGILYSNDEVGERQGKIGGGGAIIAYRIDPKTGNLAEINQLDSLSCNPSYLYLDKPGSYMMTCHCADPWHVTKIVKHADGSFGNEVVFDDTSIVLMKLNQDGSLGNVCDVDITPGSGGKDPNSRRDVDPVSGHVQLVRVLSRLHSIVPSPSGKILAVCDKGMDRIHTYRIDRAHGKLERLFTWQAPEIACFPRYSAFHPDGKAFYANNEQRACINTFRYEDETGKLERIAQTELLKEEPGSVNGKPVGAQDILVHPNGKMLYCTLTGLNLIVCCALDEKGIPKAVQQFNCRGNMPRGIALSPDGRFLLCGNMLSGNVSVFSANEDGYLTDTGYAADAVSPSAIRFYSVDVKGE